MILVVLPSIAIAHQVLETDRTPFSLPLPGLCRRVLHPLRYSQYCRFFSLSTTRLRTHSLSQSMHLAGEYQKGSFLETESSCPNKASRNFGRTSRNLVPIAKSRYLLKLNVFGTQRSPGPPVRGLGFTCVHEANQYKQEGNHNDGEPGQI